MTSDAYFAGLFDGEGSFSIQVQIRTYKGVENAQFNPRMTMTLKYGHECLYELQRRFGGQVYEYDDGNARWNLSRREPLIAAAEALRPHLVIKGQICDAFLRAMECFPKTRAGVNQYGGERVWAQEDVLFVARTALMLNPYRKSPKTRAIVDRLEAIYAEEEQNMLLDLETAAEIASETVE